MRGLGDGLYLIRLISSLVSYALFVVIAALDLLFVAGPVYLLQRLYHPKPRATFQALISFAFKLTFFLSPLIRRVEVDGAEKLEACRPAVLVPTHPSFLDYPLMASIVHDIAFLTNKSASQFVLFRRVVDLLGAHLIRPGDVAASYDLFTGLNKRLAEGSHVLIFPEGTRNASSTLAPFHRGAFKVAITAGRPVLPLIIRNSDKVFRKGSVVARNLWPVIIRIRVMDPIFPREEESPGEFAARVREQMQAELGRSG